MKGIPLTLPFARRWVPGAVMHRLRRPSTPPHSRRRSQRGQTLIVAVLMVTVVVTIAGGVIDLTAAQLHHAQDQAAADAASLTAASEVELALRSFDTPVQALAQANDAGTHIAASDGCDASCTVTFQYEEANGSVAPTVADATEVTATLVDGSSPLAFGSIPGLGPIALTLYATALIPTGSSELALGCTVCTLGSSGTSGNLTFTPGVTIPPICVLLVCAPTVTASLEQTLNVTGTIQANGDTGVIAPAGLNRVRLSWSDRQR